MHYSKHVLPNGMRVMLVPMKDNPTVTVSVSVEAGSKYETKEISGISHFLEHLCFKGTKKRPSAFHITSELDGMGASYNAFTSQEFTSYYAKVRAANLDKILDILADLYLNPIFPEKEIEKEKGVIVEEINMYEDSPQDHVQDLFTGLLYGDQPAGWNVAGTREVVKRLNREDFIAYRDKHYVAEGTIVSVAGHFNEKEVLAKIKKLFKNIPVREKGTKAKVIEMQQVPNMSLKERKGEQSHLVLGFRTFDIYNPKTPIVSLLGAILGGGMSSRLFQKLRDEMGIGYYVNAGNDSGTDSGVLAVSAGVDPKRIEEAISAILGEIKKFISKPVPPKELNRVKEHMIGHLYLGLESSNSLANFYGFQEVLKRQIRKPEEIVKIVKGITAKQVQTIAKEIFQNNRLNLSVIGPFADQKKFSDILKI